jgi:hypothetical protein
VIALGLHLADMEHVDRAPRQIRPLRLGGEIVLAARPRRPA